MIDADHQKRLDDGDVFNASHYPSNCTWQVTQAQSQKCLSSVYIPDEETGLLRELPKVFLQKF
jgi:hypothetical protein